MQWQLLVVLIPVYAMFCSQRGRFRFNAQLEILLGDPTTEIVALSIAMLDFSRLIG